MTARALLRIRALLALGALAAGFGLTSGPAPSSAAAKKKPRIKLPASKGQRWKLSRAFEFNSPASAPKGWLTQRDDWIKGGVPYSNLEGPHYSAGNVSVQNGAMRLVLGRDSSGVLTAAQANARYSLAFRYGYLEARIRVPKCSGCWPAFWMLPRYDRWPPEIDIFEYADSLQMPWPYSGLHWRSSDPSKIEDYSSKVLSPRHAGDYTGRWQTYGMLWNSKRISVYLNGRRGASFTQRIGIPRQSMYPVLQMAVGAGRAPASGHALEVDYVRLWRLHR